MSKQTQLAKLVADLEEDTVLEIVQQHIDANDCSKTVLVKIVIAQSIEVVPSRQTS